MTDKYVLPPYTLTVLKFDLNAITDFTQQHMDFIESQIRDLVNMLGTRRLDLERLDGITIAYDFKNYVETLVGKSFVMPTVKDAPADMTYVPS